MSNSSSYYSYLNACLFKLAEDVIVCRIAFHCWAEGKDDFLHPTLLDALHKALNLQIARTDAIHRTDNAAKDMIQAFVLQSILNCHYILNVLYHANKTGITIRIAANLTTVFITDIVANLTIMHTSTHLNKTLSQSLYSALILSKQVKSKSQSRLAAYSRQTVDFHYGFLKKLRRIV